MTERKKRPRDFAQRAKMIVDIATGEIEHHGHRSGNFQNSTA
jgi:hypothetical protein